MADDQIGKKNMSDDDETREHSDAPDSAELENGPTVDDALGEDKDRFEGAVPPGYDWPTHGGYLGCLLGLVAACLVGAFLGTFPFAALSYHHLVPPVVTLLVTIVIFLAVAIGLGRLGWYLGKRFYRDYGTPQPPEDQRPSDDYTAATEASDAPSHSHTNTNG